MVQISCGYSSPFLIISSLLRTQKGERKKNVSDFDTQRVFDPGRRSILTVNLPLLPCGSKEPNPENRLFLSSAAFPGESGICHRLRIVDVLTVSSSNLILL